MSAVQPFLIGYGWIPVLDGNDTARAIFHRHYSYRPYKDGRKPKLIVGPGQKLVLLWHDATALFIWRKFKNGDGQQGVNCAVFRNEEIGRQEIGRRSSDLIRAADELADIRWPGERHYTYVNPRRVAAGEVAWGKPGWCFLKAGWRTLPGTTKVRKLLILEREAPHA